MSSRAAEEFGPYLVYEQLGIGGMASVHRAETQGVEGFRRPIALKRMLPHVAGDKSLVKSFVSEARLASHLRHENVAQTYELGKVGDIYFIAMELVTGHTLREILKHCVLVGLSMPIPIALNILNQLCDALDYAHNLCDDSGTPLGIIHRDVSPSNLIVSEGSGVVKLIDFGIAKAANSGNQTQSGVVKGKFSYMAPEYIEGRLDARADLFAVGVIAYELLTNRPLFAGKDDMDTLMRVRKMQIPPPSTVNRKVGSEIDLIVMTALERDPEKRWHHATALRTAMTTVTKRLGLVALNSQVIEWVEWAFQQTRRPPEQAVDDDVDSDPDILVSGGTQAGAALGRGSDPAASGNITMVDVPLAEPPRQQRPSQPPIANRPSQPQPIQFYRPTQPQALSHHPDRPPPQRTSDSMQAQLNHPLGPSAQIPAQRPSDRMEAGAPADARERRGVIIAMVVVLAVAGAAVAVYFALPYFT